MNTAIVLLLVAACALVVILAALAFRKDYLLHLKLREAEMFLERREQVYHRIPALALPAALVRFALGGWRRVRPRAGGAPPVRSRHHPRWSTSHRSRVRPRFSVVERARVPS